MGTLSLVMVILSQIYIEYALNIGISIISSYLITRGIGMFLGYRYEFVYYFEYHDFNTIN